MTIATYQAHFSVMGQVRIVLIGLIRWKSWNLTWIWFTWVKTLANLSYFPSSPDRTTAIVTTWNMNESHNSVKTRVVPAGKLRFIGKTYTELNCPYWNPHTHFSIRAKLMPQQGDQFNVKPGCFGLKKRTKNRCHLTIDQVKTVRSSVSPHWLFWLSFLHGGKSNEN